MAFGTGRCENNPATAIRTVLKPVPPQKNFARLKNIEDISTLLNNIIDYKGTPIVRAARQLLSLTFVRPGQLATLWIVAAQIKKQRAVFKNDLDRVHYVPLSRQAIAILRDIQPLTVNGRYVFTGLRTAVGSKYECHMAAETLISALRRMGYSKEEMSAHGFRGIASTRIREDGKGKFSGEVIEAQLSHIV